MPIVCEAPASLIHATRRSAQPRDTSFDALERKVVDAWSTATKYLEVQAAWAKDQESKGVKDTALVLKKVDAILRAAAK